jgi:hypothetical protein
LLFVEPIAVLVFLFIFITPARTQTNSHEFNDSHFHLTNNIQEGPTIRDFLNMMGSQASRVALFGVPLQQEWSYRVQPRKPVHELSERLIFMCWTLSTLKYIAQRGWPNDMEFLVKIDDELPDSAKLRHFWKGSLRKQLG